MDLSEAGYSTFGNRFIIAGGFSISRDNINDYIYEYDIEDEVFRKLTEELQQWVDAPTAVLTG